MSNNSADLILYKQRVLPKQIERARKRLEHLEAEAVRYALSAEGVL